MLNKKGPDQLDLIDHDTLAHPPFQKVLVQVSYQLLLGLLHSKIGWTHWRGNRCNQERFEDTRFVHCRAYQFFRVAQPRQRVLAQDREAWSWEANWYSGIGHSLCSQRLRFNRHSSDWPRQDIGLLNTIDHSHSQPAYASEKWRTYGSNPSPNKRTLQLDFHKFD